LGGTFKDGRGIATKRLRRFWEGKRQDRTLHCRMRHRCATNGIAIMVKSTKKKELKVLQLSFRFSERLRDILEALAERENRSLANTLEVAVLHYAKATGLEEPGATASGKAAKKKATRKR